MMGKPEKYSSIAHGREYVEQNRAEGVRCPCCDQMAKEYTRRINVGMARTIINLYRKHGLTFGHGPTLPGDSHEISQLAWWGLIEEEERVRPDGGRAGYWRVTELGQEYIWMRHSPAKYVTIYNGEVVRIDSSQRASIKDALGKKFSYKELMEGI